MGLMLAEPEFHTRCWVEWEAYPRYVLTSGMRAGYLAQAPIWDNVKTFDARPYAGAFDTLIAGYPCQPFSMAGQRKGEDDERHLWPDIERIIGALGNELRWCFFENVSGHLTLGLETVLHALHRLGFRTAAGLFSAEEVGAAHERQRVFIVAHRESSDRRGEQQSKSPRRGRARLTGSSEELANTVSNAGHERRCGFGGDRAPGRVRETNRFSASRPAISPPGPSDSEAWAAVLRVAPDLAPSVAFGDIASRAYELAALVEAGELAEAEAEPALCRMVDGLASRARALRLLGNGVHPLAAAYAWRTLSAPHGLGWVDLERAR